MRTAARTVETASLGVGDRLLYHYTTERGIEGMIEDEELYSPSYYRKTGVRRRSDDYGDWGVASWFTSADYWETDAAFAIPGLDIWASPESVGEPVYRIAILQSACEWMYIGPVRYRVICGADRPLQHFATLEAVPMSRWEAVGQYQYGTRSWRDEPVEKVRAALARQKDAEWNKLDEFVRTRLPRTLYPTLGSIRELVQSFERAKARRSERLKQNEQTSASNS